MRLWLLALALGIVSLTSSAQPSSWKRGDGVISEEEFNARISILYGDNTTSLYAQDDIEANMRLGLPFYGLQITTRKSGDDDEWQYVPGISSSFDTWPDGAYSQLLWCVQAANATMRAAMAACGGSSQAECDAEFVVYSMWGTLDGMQWKRDGVMLYQCIGVRTTKSKCVDASKPPCELSILGDFHATMWPAINSVNIIGNGSTTTDQMAAELQAYSAAAGGNDSSWLLQTTATGKRDAAMQLVRKARVL